MTTMPDPWERLPNERATAYAAFVNYLADPDRVVGDKRHQNWSTRNQWKARALPYDAMMVRARIEADMRRRLKDDEQQHSVGKMMISRGTQKLINIDPGQLSVSDAVRLNVEGVRMVRMANGSDTERTSSFVAVAASIEVERIHDLDAEQTVEELIGTAQEMARLVGARLVFDADVQDAEVVEEPAPGLPELTQGTDTHGPAENGSRPAQGAGEKRQDNDWEEDTPGVSDTLVSDPVEEIPEEQLCPSCGKRGEKVRDLPNGEEGWSCRTCWPDVFEEGL